MGLGILTRTDENDDCANAETGSLHLLRHPKKICTQYYHNPLLLHKPQTPTSENDHKISNLKNFDGFNRFSGAFRRFPLFSFSFFLFFFRKRIDRRKENPKNLKQDGRERGRETDVSIRKNQTRGFFFSL